MFKILFSFFRSLGKVNGNFSSSSFKNLYKSSKFIYQKPALVSLHNSLIEVNENIYKFYKKLDYGSGYFYQSYESLGIFGIRSTEERINSLNLNKYIVDRNVLDIGSNSGFFSLSLAAKANNIVGIEPNNFLNQQANLVKKYLNIDNVEFITTKFENFTSEKMFDTILSFANHSTYDGETEFSLEEYFSKVSELLSTTGFMIFESHHPKIEKDFFKVQKVIENYFEIVDKKICESENFYDDGRTWIVAKVKKS